MSASERNAKSVPEAGGAMPRPEEKRIILARDIFPERLPIVPVSSRPLFPRMIAPLIVDDPKGRKAIADVLEAQSKFVGVVLLKPKEDSSEPVKAADLHSVGVAAEIIRVNQAAPEAPLQVMLGALERFAIESIVSDDPVIQARVRYLPETEMSVNEELKAYSVSIINAIKALEGMPRVRSGMKLVCAPALLAASGPATPSMAPLPKRDGSLAIFFSSA